MNFKDSKDLLLVDRVAATVNEQVITVSEVYAKARIILVLRGGKGALELPIDDSLKKDVLDFLINQAVVLSEAERLSVFDINKTEINKKTEQFKNFFLNDIDYLNFLTKIGIDQDELENVLSKDLRVDRYLKNKVSLLVKVSDKEIRNFYQKNSNRFKGKSYQQMYQVVKSYLFNIQYEKMIKTWLRDLKAKSHIRQIWEF